MRNDNSLGPSCRNPMQSIHGPGIRFQAPIPEIHVSRVNPWVFNYPWLMHASLWLSTVCVCCVLAFIDCDTCMLWDTTDHLTSTFYWCRRHVCIRFIAALRRQVKGTPTRRVSNPRHLCETPLYVAGAEIRNSETCKLGYQSLRIANPIYRRSGSRFVVTVIGIQSPQNL